MKNINILLQNLEESKAELSKDSETELEKEILQEINNILFLLRDLRKAQANW